METQSGDAMIGIIQTIHGKIKKTDILTKNENRSLALNPSYEKVKFNK